jgi:Probable zinc-ribbon domain
VCWRRVAVMLCMLARSSSGYPSIVVLVDGSRLVRISTFQQARSFPGRGLSTMLTDRSLTCPGLSQVFTVTPREQEFLTRRGSTSSPTRCRDWRGLRRASRRPEPSSDRAAGSTS